MPPWFADPHYGKFANDRRMEQREIDTIVAWVNAGAPEGNPKDLPKPLAFVEGWNIGTPDLAVTMPRKYEIPATGTIDYQYILVPLNLTEDKWVQAAEVRPGNRALVHHVIAFVRPPGSNWMKSAVPGVPYEAKKGRRQRGFPRRLCAGRSRGCAAGRPGGLVKAGSDIVLQLHYTANGKPGTDQTTVGVKYSRVPVKEKCLYNCRPEQQIRDSPGRSEL